MDDPATMREAWNRRARRDAFLYVETAHWDGDVNAFFRLGEERCRQLVDPVLERLPRPAAECGALDLGCGVGRVSRALAARFGSVTGVDVSDEMVARAVELHPEERFPGLRFLATDGVSLPLEDRSIDFAFSYEVVQHMPSRDVIERNLREVARVLRGDGLALVHVPTRARAGAALKTRLARRLPEPLVRFAKTRILRQDPLVSDLAFRGAPPFRPEEVEPAFARAGLVVDEVRDDPTHPPGSRALVLARAR